MDAYNTAEGESSVTNDGCTDLEKRDVRALTEYMTVLPLGGNVFSVTTESGSEYRVDGVEGRCTCPDYTHNLPTDDGREQCKHLSRVAFATGETPIPAWVDADAIDEHLGDHTEAPVCWETTAPFPVSNSGATSREESIRTDGGETVVSGEAPDDGPQYTYHYEPAHVGGARYVRCETCGAECVPAKPARLAHREGCSEGER